MAGYAASLSDPGFMREACKELSKRDARLMSLINKVGIVEQKLAEDLFFSIIEAILSQQLTPKAANSIIERFVSLFGKRSVTPHSAAELSDEQLRSCGISRQKVSYIRSLCMEFKDYGSELSSLHEMEDREIVERLVRIKGVGVWTAKMILIFSLGRPDVLPFEDLGILNAVKKVYSLGEKPGRKQLERIAENWHPYCSVASLYLWKLKDELPWDRQY